MTMYGCSIDQRLMLPRSRSGGAAAVRSSGLNAASHDDESAGLRVPFVRLVGHDRHRPGERSDRTTVVDVHDVRMRPRPVKNRPDWSGRRHLDDLVLAGVNAEFDVHTVLPRAHKAHARA